MRAKTIDEEVLELPASRRADLAARLLTSLEEAPVSTHWQEEAENRIDALESGRITTEAADEVLGYRGSSGQ